MLYRPWHIPRPQPSQAAALAQELQVSQLVCNVLLSRGYTDAAKASSLLGAGAPLSRGEELLHMDKACRRILDAVDGGERITVFGDYDVDGVSATALLYTYLDSIGADVYYKLPSRDEDGYGLSDGIIDLLASKGVTLIITVDSGVSSVGPVAYAKTLGIDVVITDHHLPPEVLPDAAAIINPLQPGDTSPCKTLCGVGVAFKLVAALDGSAPEELLDYYADLVAIGTIADIMKLEGENRTMVKAGLALMQQPEREGLAALIEECGFGGKPITADSVSYGIAPRLNAAGRMDSANEALELLLCDNEEDARRIAASLNEKNIARQTAEQEISGEIIDKVTQDATYADDRILVVWGEGYHAGVIGIVASRLVDRFGKPALVVSIDENGEGKGSGRSLGDISLHSALTACEDMLIRYGGHALAAGMSIRREQLPAFRKAINEWARKNHPVLQMPPLAIDTPVTLQQLTPENVADFELLAPFGSGNPSPLFIVENVTLDAVYAMSDGKHSRLRLRSGSFTVYAALFGTPPSALAYKVGDAVDAAISLSVFEGKTGPMVSGRIKEIRPAGLADTYVPLVQLYAAYRGGAELTKEEKAQLKPAREDTVAVYRLTQQGVPAEDLRPLFAAVGAENAGKAMVSVAALCELGLVHTVQENGAALLRAVPGAAKQDLASAGVLRALEE